MVGIGTNEAVIAEIKQYTPKGYCKADDIVVASGSGCHFTDLNQNSYLDFTSGIFTNSFGHCFAPLMEAEKKQLAVCDNIHGRHSVAECRFYEKLAAFMPLPDYKFIPYNDGGYAVDRGLSDIINYYGKERIPIAAFRGGFHGKTMGTKLTINETAHAALFENFQVDFPNCYRCPWKKQYPNCQKCCIEKICAQLRERKTKAIIFEVIQGAGVIIPPSGFWQAMAEFCQKNKIVMFADEVLTGGGRTGYFLASYGWAKIAPDVISLTKGLANGRPLSVLCEREYITDNPYGCREGERSSTFAAHPINMAVAAENLQCLEKYNIFENVRRMGNILHEKLSELKALSPHIGDIRSVGLMAAIEFVKDKETKEPDVAYCREVFANARKNGLETILSGHILRLAPPLNITSAELGEGLDKLSQSIKY